MKRLFAITIMVWYAVLSMGFQIHVHYCCGNVAGIAINQFSVEEENCCGSHHEGCSLANACCSSDDFYLALEEEHKTPSEQIIPMPPVFQPVVISEEKQVQHISLTNEETTVWINGPPLYLWHNARLHYG